MATTKNTVLSHNRIVTTINGTEASGESDQESFDGAVAISVQAVGTFDSATFTVEASNDGETFAVLTTTVTFAVAGLKALALVDLGYRFYRVSWTGGGASTDVNIIFAASIPARP